jgi:hypothetical protein
MPQHDYTEATHGQLKISVEDVKNKGLPGGGPFKIKLGGIG